MSAVRDCVTLRVKIMCDDCKIWLDTIGDEDWADAYLRAKREGWYVIDELGRSITRCPSCQSRLEESHDCWFCGGPGPSKTKFLNDGTIYEQFPCGGYSQKTPGGPGAMGMGIGCYKRKWEESAQDCVILRQALFYMAGRFLDARGKGPSTYSTYSGFQRATHSTIRWILETAFKDTRFRDKIEMQMRWRYEQIKDQSAMEVSRDES